MARKGKRRQFGKIETKTNRHHGTYYQASYPTPIEAFAEYPGLGQRQYRNFDDATAAAGWLGAEKRLIDSGAWTPVRERERKASRSTVTFAEYAASYVETHRKRNGEPLREGTREKYRQYLRDHLNPVLGAKRMTAIRPADIQAWYDGMDVTKDGRGASIRKHVYDLLNGIMSEAATRPLDDTGATLIPTNPVQFRPPTPGTRHEYVIATRAQVQALADAMPPSMRLSVLIAGVMGLRQGEVLGLQRRDVELGRSPALLHVRRAAKDGTVNGHKANVLGELKTARSRRDIEIPAPLVPVIQAHMDTYTGNAPTALLFTGIRSHGIVSGQSIRNMFARAKQAVGGRSLDGMTFHDLRHSALTHYAQDGATVGQLMQKGGHTNIKTVAVYQQSSADADKRLSDNVNAELASAMNPAETPHTSASAVTPSVGDDDMAGMVDVLASMPLDDRVAVLLGLDAGRRSRVVALLPQAVQVKTVTELFKVVQ
ncbi:tyrosine-type recombinase/integrase [Bifidobacterium pullorum]|uniref:tyrosine-type recombinase/integrase n=1 Tax=Bifidobacterium pullorum TaxID=78448 RepID=UPI00399546BD